MCTDVRLDMFMNDFYMPMEMRLEWLCLCLMTGTISL
jgi:hypothetical protein